MKKIDDLYFGIKFPEMFPSGKNTHRLESINLFDSSKVKRSVAIWVAGGEEFQKEHNFASWCFGDVWGRCEYEWMVCPWPYEKGDKIEDLCQKVDVYGMYVLPNEKLLHQMVDEVSVSSAKKYLTEERKKWRRK